MARLQPRLSDLPALAMVLAANLAVAVPVGIHMGRKITLPEYYYPALEFARVHRIASDFLPIGYSAALGLAVWLTGSLRAVDAADALISLATVAAAWAWLRLQGSTVPQALAITLLLTFYPDFLLSFFKVEDTKLTELLLFSFLAALAWALRARQPGIADLALGVVLGWSVLTRTNMLLLVAVACGFLVGTRAPRALLRSGIYVAIAAGLYCAVTAAVHGRFFLPQNGPYNLFAGANPYTREYMLNEEDSIGPALRPLGIAGSVTWSEPANRPGVTDFRDADLKPIYSREAMSFARRHPGMMVELSALKFVTLLRPDLQVYRAKSPGGMVKIVSALGFPLWLIGLPFLPLRNREGLILRVTVLAYVLPFVFTISAPRFAVPLDLVCWMDIAATLAPRRSPAESTRLEPALNL